jgi:hypothetical protein
MIAETPDATDELVPDPQVAREFSVTAMTLWRWDRDPELAELGWPEKIKIRNRNFRFRSRLERFKSNILARALADREGRTA